MIFWLVVCFSLFFHSVGNNDPNWLIFFRGVGQPPTSIWIIIRELSNTEFPRHRMIPGLMIQANAPGAVTWGGVFWCFSWDQNGTFTMKIHDDRWMCIVKILGFAPWMSMKQGDNDHDHEKNKFYLDRNNIWPWNNWTFTRNKWSLNQDLSVNAQSWHLFWSLATKHGNGETQGRLSIASQVNMPATARENLSFSIRNSLLWHSMGASVGVYFP